MTEAEIPEAWTALHYAATEQPDLSAAVRALDQGVSVDARTRDSYEATALHRAAGHGRVPGMIALLVRRGADVNARNSRGRTPLHLAIRYGAPPYVIAELIAAGGDRNAKDDQDLRPADLADPVNH